MPFAHVADGAEQKAGCPRSQRQSFPVLQVLLTTVDGLKSPLPPQLHQFSEHVNFLCLHTSPQKSNLKGMRKSHLCPS